MLEHRANALLFDEDTSTFYQNNLGIYPKDGIKFALSYVMTILNVLLKTKENQPMYKDMSKAIKKVKERYAITEFVTGKQPKEIIAMFEQSCYDKSEVQNKK